MKYEMKIIDEWPDIAKERCGFIYIDLLDESLTPDVRNLFFLDNGIVYEHRVMCPFLSGYDDGTLFKVEFVDSSTFILDSDCKWPDGTSLDSGFIPKSDCNTGDCGYHTMHSDSEVIPSHLEINLMRRYYEEHKNKTCTFPLLKINVIS